MELRKRRPRTDINIVPLIDVLIVLVFFFLMTMQFRNMNVLEITPPQVETAGQTAEVPPVVISITKDGELSLGPDPTTFEALPGALAAIAAEGHAPGVLVQADEDAPVKYLTAVMDEARKAELGRLRLLTR